MPFNAKPATRFCTRLLLELMLPELLRRRDAESGNDDDFEGDGLNSSKGDWEDKIEGEGEDDDLDLEGSGGDDDRDINGNGEDDNRQLDGVSL